MQKVKKVNFATLNEDGQVISTEELDSPIPIIRNHYNSKYFQKHGEVNTLPSLTIPDEAMSIGELLKRYGNGLPLTLGREPIYDGEEELTDLERLDLSERKAVIDEYRERIREADEEIKKRKQAAEDAKLDKIVAERVARKLAEQQKGGQDDQPK